MKAMLSRGIIFLLVLAGMPAQAIEPLILHDQCNAKRIDPEKWSGVEGFAAPRNPNAEASRLIRRGALRVQLKTYRGGGITINGTSARRDRPVATRILDALARLADGRGAAARFIGLRMSTHGAIHMKIHLVDGTYELFRSFFGAPPKKAPDGREVGATLGLLNSLLSLLSKSGATHLACAFDHVIESFRNDLFAGYKTSTGVASDLLAQFSLAEEAVAALGVVVWPMVAFEADDALATAATRLRSEPGVDQVVICSPDKDLAQVVSGNQVVCWDRRRGIMYDEEAVLAKFGVRPGSIPDWLALVGDAADGYPGLPGWGPKSASAVLSRYEHLESIPEDPGRWDLGRARALRLAESLRAHQAEVLLYRRLATLRQDVSLHERSLDLEWHGAQDRLKPLCRELGDDKILARVPRWISASPAS